MNNKVFFIILFGLAVMGCETSLDPAGEIQYGLGKAPNGLGPKVVYDPLAKPLPEVPLPNDVATRLDPSSATGRRLNISTRAPTEYERAARRQFNLFDGFGTYAPITVSFDMPLDIENILSRHKNNDFRDDAFFLLNLSPECKRYGEEVLIDVQSGRFPVIHYGRERLKWDPQAPDGYRFSGGNPLFDFDPWGAQRNVFSQENEDVNENGQLEAHEDLDGDGILDVANLLDPKACSQTTPPKCAANCA